MQGVGEKRSMTLLLGAIVLPKAQRFLPPTHTVVSPLDSEQPGKGRAPWPKVALPQWLPLWDLLGKTTFNWSMGSRAFPLPFLFLSLKAAAKGRGV